MQKKIRVTPKKKKIMPAVPKTTSSKHLAAYTHIPNGIKA
jgi:hypothetical protein